MLPDRVSNPGPLTCESGALPIALRGPAIDLSDTGFKICPQMTKQLVNTTLNLLELFSLKIEFH